jgi:DNA-cytosine methyltransferase
MTHGSLFSGIGGFDLAAEWMGWENVFHCEINPYAKKLLKQRWPQSIAYGNIETTDFRVHRGLDVLSGGWPCQDNSRAKQTGRGQLGLAGERSGLFYHAERAICEARPTYFVGENVPDVLTINGGRDFNYILSAMARMGYNVTWGMLRASDIGAPHHRERLYMVAYASSVRLQTLQSIWTNVCAKVKKERRVIAGAAVQVGGAWKDSPFVLRMDDGIPNTAHRFEMCGNAVVPIIPYEIFKAIAKTNNHE